MNEIQTRIYDRIVENRREIVAINNEFTNKTTAILATTIALTAAVVGVLPSTVGIKWWLPVVLIAISVGLTIGTVWLALNVWTPYRTSLVGSDPGDDPCRPLTDSLYSRYIYKTSDESFHQMITDELSVIIDERVINKTRGSIFKRFGIVAMMQILSLVAVALSLLYQPKIDKLVTMPQSAQTHCLQNTRTM